jgi:hypothetical protein
MIVKTIDKSYDCRINDAVSYEQVDAECFVYNARTDQMLVLNGTAATIFLYVSKLVADAVVEGAVDDIFVHLQSCYEIPDDARDAVIQDILSTLDKFKHEELFESSRMGIESFVLENYGMQRGSIRFRKNPNVILEKNESEYTLLHLKRNEKMILSPPEKAVHLYVEDECENKTWCGMICISMMSHQLSERSGFEFEKKVFRSAFEKLVEFGVYI